MKFRVPGSNREVWVNIKKYRVDWDKPTRSKFQSSVKQFLRPYLENHIVAEEFRIPRTKLTVDLIDFTSKVAYEIQGKQHSEYVPFFHGNLTGFYRQFGRDAKKAQFLEYNGYKLVEINPEDLVKLSRAFFVETFKIYL